MNWGIIGHQWAVALLKEHIRHHQLRHAYLFTGPRSVGKRTLALGLAQAIHCPQSNESLEPCLQCRVCKRFQEMSHPDLSVVEAETEGGVLKVEQIRALQHSLALTPYESQYRIALLIRFEEAHPAAANALLKTLEEPNPQVIFLITASHPELLPPTITSRCEILHLRPLSMVELEQALQLRYSIPGEQANLLAHVSSGRPGFAIDLLLHPEKQAARTEHLNHLLRLLTANRQERMAFALALSEDKNISRVRTVLLTWLTFWRDVMLSASHASAPLTNQDYRSQIEYLSRWIEAGSALRYISQIEQVLDLISRNVNLRLALEILFLDLPQMRQIADNVT